MDGSYCADYISLMQKKLGAIEKMREITIGQRVFIDKDDAGGLAFSMELRQNCIENINKCDVGMKLLLDQNGHTYESIKAALTPADCDCLEHMRRTAFEWMQEISNHDTANRPAAEEKLNAYMAEIRVVTIQQKAVKAYAMNDNETSVIFDEKK